MRSEWGLEAAQPHGLLIPESDRWQEQLVVASADAPRTLLVSALSCVHISKL